MRHVHEMWCPVVMLLAIQVSKASSDARSSGVGLLCPPPTNRPGHAQCAQKHDAVDGRAATDDSPTRHQNLGRAGRAAADEVPLICWLAARGVGTIGEIEATDVVGQFRDLEKIGSSLDQTHRPAPVFREPRGEDGASAAGAHDDDVVPLQGHRFASYTMPYMTAAVYGFRNGLNLDNLDETTEDEIDTSLTHAT